MANKPGSNNGNNTGRKSTNDSNGIGSNPTPPPQSIRPSAPGGRK